eukprot:763563-Hanusia_phi.AAC.4
MYKNRGAAESSIPRMLVRDGDGTSSRGLLSERYSSTSAGWVWRTNLAEKLDDASKWFEGASNNFIKL